ncbi:hypothetical protein M0812_16178 [Anaeramoeba flamelloides]|uniref:Uncharacterized protein n=1 Tax=Anaeramoeba flamelloides TaxID=1746091 RepID=A0AAV7ZJH6_9EUKA|nr:hypothetical protein M0812_16178 [Anaeramoeba flamelloides]
MNNNNQNRNTKKSKNYNSIHSSNYGEIVFLTSTRLNQIIIQEKKDFEQKVYLNFLNLVTKGSVIFLLMIYNFSKGKDPRIRKNLKIKELDIGNLSFYILPIIRVPS